MKLEKYKEESQYYTGKLSDINRYLSFAGIAVIWIFKKEQESVLSIPSELYLPLIAMVISLLLDFCQYLYGSIVWSQFFRYHEKKKAKKPNKDIYRNDDIKSPKLLSNISYYIFFYPKALANIIGYYLIIRFLIDAVKLYS